ncbi:MAG: hypothetical protein M1485_05180 [Chloroflexi bacterium]|nr:hypothetical protein [Chloroflexota bacterium]
MSHIYKFALLSVLVIATLACGLITNPINQAQGLASTAQAMASSMPIETLQAVASAMPSGIPNIPGLGNVGDYLNPTGTPVSTWNDIPIMTQATAGQEFNQNTYSFKAGGIAESDVQTFYTDKLKALGWTSAFGFQGGGQGGVMLFTKDSKALAITVTMDDSNNVIVILLLQ